jgi:hypothetical protein
MLILLALFACTSDDPKDDTAAPADTDADADTDTDADTDADTDTDTDTDVTLAGTCTDDTHWGAFLVDSSEEYAFVTGSISDGVVPVTVLTNVVTSGACTIWRRENPFCDPTCSPGYTCDLTGTCVVYPTTQDLGTVDVTGLSQAVSMEPVTPGYNYYDTSLPNPPWDAGDLLTLRTSGGSYEPVTLHGYAPTTLVPVSMDWTITPSAPLAVAWDAPTGPVNTELVLSLRIDQHGTTPSSIECTFADDGAAEVPGDVIDTLMSYGVTGFPAGDLLRRTADSTPIGGGCIDLVASSSRFAQVTIEGYTPCRSDGECPDGQTCNEALERCE